MNKEFGVTIYPFKDFDVDKNKAYIDLVKKYGVTRVFATTFCLQPEDIANKDYLDKFKTLAKYIQQAGLSLQIDLFPEIFDAFNASADNIDPILDVGVTELRIDAGYTMQEIAQMTKNERCKKIVINASEIYRLLDNGKYRPVELEAVLDKDIEEFLKHDGILEKIEASHNMYPHPDSGISYDLARRNKAALSKYNIAVSAFIPAQEYECTLFNMNASSPTIEEQRNLYAWEAARELFYLELADTAFIADGYVSKKELSKLKDAYEIETLKLRLQQVPELCDKAQDLLFNKVHFNRGVAQYLIRSTGYRGISVKQVNNVIRNKYSVFIDNCTVERYLGELSITLKDLPASSKFNNVGTIHPHDRCLIDNFKTGQEFIFIVEKK